MPGRQIPQAAARANPSLSKPSDYPDVGATGPAGMSHGRKQIVQQTFEQESPRHASGFLFTVGQSQSGGKPVDYECYLDTDSGECH